MNVLFVAVLGYPEWKVTAFNTRLREPASSLNDRSNHMMLKPTGHSQVPSPVEYPAFPGDLERTIWPVPRHRVTAHD